MGSMRCLLSGYTTSGRAPGAMSAHVVFGGSQTLVDQNVSLAARSTSIFMCCRTRAVVSTSTADPDYSVWVAILTEAAAMDVFEVNRNFIQLLCPECT